MDWKTVVDRLAELRRKAPRKKVFGADDHGFELNPTLPEKSVRAFEQRHGVTLPGDYREFLRLAGNGGAGPYYGVFKLGEMDDGHGFEKWKAKGPMVGDLAAPFPFAKAWNDQRPLPKEPATFPSEEEEEAFHERYDACIEKHYWFALDGAIPICHAGCAERFWLVVSGPCAGQVWRDSRADMEGVAPVVIRRRRASFADWYTDWLNALR